MSVLSTIFVKSIAWIVSVSFLHMSTLLDPTGTMNEKKIVFV